MNLPVLSGPSLASIYWLSSVEFVYVGDMFEWAITGFTLTRVRELRSFLNQLSTNCQRILHALCTSHVATTLKISRSFSRYLEKLYLIFHNYKTKF